MSEPAVGGGMVMRYYDFDRPVEVERPPCLGD
jgi:hypothetical protein